MVSTNTVSGNGLELPPQLIQFAIEPVDDFDSIGGTFAFGAGATRRFWASGSVSRKKISIGSSKTAWSKTREKTRHVPAYSAGVPPVSPSFAARNIEAML